MRRILALTLALALLCAGAAADDVTEVDLDQPGTLSVSGGYIRASALLEEAGPVVLSVWGPTGALIYQRTWTAPAGRTVSDSIYLALDGTETVYTVQLQTQTRLHSRSVRRVSPRLTGCSACSCGLPLSALTGRSDRGTVTILDLRSLARSPMTVALHAGSAYMIGTAAFRMDGGRLVVSAQTIPGMDISIDAADVQIALTSVTARTLGRRDFGGVRAALDLPVDVADAGYAAVYVNLTVSFSPGSLPTLTSDELPGQSLLWEQMQQYTAASGNG